MSEKEWPYSVCPPAKSGCIPLVGPFNPETPGAEWHFNNRLGEAESVVRKLNYAYVAGYAAARAEAKELEWAVKNASVWLHEMSLLGAGHCEAMRDTSQRLAAALAKWEKK